MDSSIQNDIKKVNDLKFGKLLSLCAQINVGLSRLEFTKYAFWNSKLCNDLDQTASSKKYNFMHFERRNAFFSENKIIKNKMCAYPT